MTPQHNKRLERTRRERASLLSNFGEPLKRNVGWLLFSYDGDEYLQT
jgi:hypothetical protein